MICLRMFSLRSASDDHKTKEHAVERAVDPGCRRTPFAMPKMKAPTMIPTTVLEAAGHHDAPDHGSRDGLKLLEVALGRQRC